MSDSSQQQPLQQPVFAYPNSVTTQPSSSHSNGSFGSVFIVLAVIVVVSGIACCIGRFCNRKMQKPMKGSKTKSKHNSHQAPPPSKFHPQQSRRKDRDDLEFGFDGHPSKGADLEFGFGGRPTKDGNLEIKFNNGRPPKERDVEFGFDKRNLHSGKPLAGHGEMIRGGFKVHANGEMKGEGHQQQPEFYG